MNTIKELKDLLDLADRQSSSATFKLNTLDMRLDVSKTIQQAIDGEVSVIKGAINHILQAKAKLNEVQKNDPIVYLSLVINEGTDNEKDFDTDIFIWPFKFLPSIGDRVETYNFIQFYAPGLPSEFLDFDYFKLSYSFFETYKDGFAICLKLTTC